MINKQNNKNGIVKLLQRVNIAKFTTQQAYATEPKNVSNRAQLTQKVTPHVLRHTFATLALQKGISIAAVQKILGHDRLTTTSIYLNLTDAHVIEEYEQKWQLLKRAI